MSYLPSRNKLTDTQKRVAEILATNDIHKMTIEEIADHENISPRTIYRWKRNPDFVAYKNAIAEEAMEDFLAEAYEKLKEILRDGKSEKIQLDAIKLVLQNRGKLKETQDITVGVKQVESQEEREQRIKELEDELFDE